MQATETIKLRRDCEATLIPAGTKVTLKAGDEVLIMQSLGGSYTVISNGCPARIEGKDADAIDKEPASPLPTPSAVSTPGTGGSVNEKLIWEQMKTCFDPEIPVNIVDLGLIYDMKVMPLADDGGNRVDVKMTLTAPGCGMGEIIKSDVEQKILSVPGITEAHVELVWDPPWNQSMLSDAAKLQLGLM